MVATSVLCDISFLKLQLRDTSFLFMNRIWKHRGQYSMPRQYRGLLHSDLWLPGLDLYIHFEWSCADEWQAPNPGPSISLLYPRFNEVERGVYWFHLLRLSVWGQNRVRSVSSTILIGSISYLHILSNNFRRCVACNGCFKINVFWQIL